LASIFEQEAEEEMREKNRTQTLKYTEYRINKNILVGKLRNRLMEMVLEEDDAQKGYPPCSISGRTPTQYRSCGQRSLLQTRQTE
jgi:hypothetical protein